MTWFPPDHPAWKLAQGALTLACLVVVVWHLHAHQGNTDSTDIVGGGLALKFAGELVSWKKRDS